MKSFHLGLFIIGTALAAYFAPAIVRLSQNAFYAHFSKDTPQGSRAQTEHDLVDETNEIFSITSDELSTFTGLPGSPGMYLSILGKVYDVKEGEKHYGPGSSYNFFVGAF